MTWRSVMQRLRREGRDVLELVLLPGLAAVLPWPVCFKLFKFLAHWSWLYREVVDTDCAQAQAQGWVQDARGWCWQRRLVQLVDHADHYLHRTRSDAWLRRYVQVQGDWLAHGQPALLFTFHWGAGMWGLRHARQAGLKVHALAAPAEGAAFAGRWVLRRYAQARLRSVEQALGTDLVFVPKGLRHLRGVLAKKEQVLALLDVPQDQGQGQVCTFLGQRVLLSAAMPLLAQRQQGNSVWYVTGLDVHTGRRYLHITPLEAGLSAQALMETMVQGLERWVQEAPAAWHLWGQWPRFSGPAQAVQDVPVPEEESLCWSAEKITDAWFRSHFEYAADVVYAWLSAVVDVRSARMMQFGCGDGITDLALALRYGAGHIHGVDVRREYEKLPLIAQQQLGLEILPKALSFETIRPSAPLQGQAALYDVVMSWSTFEHVQRDQVLPILKDLYACLRPGGYFFLQIEPLYYSAFGAHLGRYDSVPWHHLLVTDDELWDVVRNCEAPLHADEVDFGFADFGPEGYKRFVFEEYQALNRLTADELVALTAEAGFSVVRQERRSYEPSPVPDVLLEKYDRDVLVNNEIFLLLQRV